MLGMVELLIVMLKVFLVGIGGMYLCRSAMLLLFLPVFTYRWSRLCGYILFRRRRLLLSLSQQL